MPEGKRGADIRPRLSCIQNHRMTAMGNSYRARNAEKFRFSARGSGDKRTGKVPTERKDILFKIQAKTDRKPVCWKSMASYFDPIQCNDPRAYIVVKSVSVVYPILDLVGFCLIHHVLADKE